MARRNRNAPGHVPQVPKSGYGLLKAVLDCFAEHSEDLAARLDTPHQAGGNPGYPAWQMLRLHALRFLLSERYANRFLARVDNDPRLLELCGMDNAPSEVAFSRFKNAKQAPHQGELFRFLAAATVEECAARVETLQESGVIPADAPALGDILAVDATDIPAYARPRGEHCDPPGKGNCKKKHRVHCDSPDKEQCTKHKPCADPDARWGYRTPKGKSPMADGSKKNERKELFFGYKANVISDAYYGIPLYINIRPANENEGPVFRQDLDAALQVHPWLKPKYLAGDKGYHALYNFRHLADLGIVPVIDVPMPQLDKKSKMRLHEGLYNEKGLPVCIGGQVMEFVETGEDGKHRFRCPPEGCRLKGRMDWSRYCDFDYAEKPNGKRLRIMGIVHRASSMWKEIYKKRTSIERHFSSVKHSRLLDKHQYLGLERVGLHARMSTLTYMMTVWGRLMAGDYEGMRQMHIRLPRRPALAAELREIQECGDCCPCSLHDSLAA